MRFTASLALAVALLFGASTASAQNEAADVSTSTQAASVAPTSKPAPLSSRLVLLYDNGPLVTNPGAGSGGADVSAIQSSYGSTLFGSGNNAGAASPIYLADDFTVPAGGWTVSDIEFFGYQTGGNPTTSTFTNVFVQIWNGPPNVAGSAVVFGDLTTNRLASSTFSGIFRTDATTFSNTQRPIYRNTVTIGATLPAGTYWVQWGSTGSLASGPWAPPVTVAGATTPPPGNALQFTAGAWQAALDGTFGIDLPFLVNGTAGTPTGPVLTVSPTSVPFGAVNVGETSTQTVTLTNNGSAPLTISSVAYTGSGSVTITQPGSLTLAAGASTTMTATFAPAAAGAATGTITITSNAPGSPVTVAVTGTGVPPPPPGTYPSTDTPVAITDNDPAGVTSTIVVPAGTAGTILDLDVDLNITHTWTGDLIITLAKGATTSTLMDRPGFTGTGFGCSGDNPNIIADDEGTDGSIEGSCVPSVPQAYPVANGRYTPNSPLTVFDGMPIAGTYTLTISDNAAGDTGSLDSWALMATLGGVATQGTPEALSSLTVAPNPVATQGQVSVRVAAAQDVRVVLYDALGREVMTLLDRAMTADQEAHIGFSTQSLPAGVYVIRATGTDLSLTERVTVVR